MLEPTTPKFVVRASTDWASRDWWKLSFKSDLYTKILIYRSLTAHGAYHTRWSVWLCYACLKQTQDLCVFLLLSNIDIFIYVTESRTRTKQNMLYFVMPRTYTNVKEIHVCIKVTFKGELSSLPASSVGRGSDYDPIQIKSSMTFIR